MDRLTISQLDGVNAILANRPIGYLNKEMKESDLLKLQLDQIVTDNKINLSNYIQFTNHTDEQFKQYMAELFAKEKEAGIKWLHQKLIEDCIENNIPLSALDDYPKSLGGNKE